MVDFDTESVHRAVMNVVTNAIDAAGQTQQQQRRRQRSDQSQGEVTVSVVLSQLKNRVSLLVADNGPGIPTEDLVRIFRRSNPTKELAAQDWGSPLAKRSCVNMVEILKSKAAAAKGLSSHLVGPLFESRQETVLPVRVTKIGEIVQLSGMDEPQGGTSSLNDENPLPSWLALPVCSPKMSATKLPS